MTLYGGDVDLAQALYVHPTAQIHGKVTAGEGVSVWTNVVIRAEMFEVRLGAHCNLQDFVMVHIGDNEGAEIGAYTSVAHRATIHGARIGENCLIGIGAIVMDGCVVGANSVVGSGSVLLPGTEIPPSSVVVGTPGKVVKTADNWMANRMNAALYSRNAKAYQRGDYRAWEGPDHEAFVERERARLEAEHAGGQEKAESG